MEQVSIAVIGGSGLYSMAEIEDRSSITLDTPFGSPSGDILLGTLRGRRVAFLPRHGVGHIYTPTTVPYRANIFALKLLGVRFVIAVNACGSLRADYRPGDLVIPDQLYDHTRGMRPHTFFDTGLVGHVSVADPLTQPLGDGLFEAVRRVTPGVHRGGTFIIIEGPRFSTRGESRIYRQWGCSLIGMTTCPEAFLAAEAEMAYATIAHVTDYDVWHEEPVTAEKVMETMGSNLQTARAAVANAVEMLDPNAVYPCHNALGAALMTAREAMSPEMVEKLRPLVGRYLAG